MQQSLTDPYPQTRDIDAFGHHAYGHQPFAGAGGKRRDALRCAGVVRGDHSCSDPQLPSQQLGNTPSVFLVAGNDQSASVGLAADLDSREPAQAGAHGTWPRSRRWAARSGAGRGRAGAAREGDSGRVWIWRWETHGCQSDTRWPPQLAGTAARTDLVAIRLQRCSGPRCDRGRNIVRLRGHCTPPEQGASMQWPTVVSVSVVSITCGFRQPMARMGRTFIGREIITAGPATRADSRGDARGYGWCCPGGDLALSAPPYLLSAVPGGPTRRHSSPRRRTGRLL